MLDVIFRLILINKLHFNANICVFEAIWCDNLSFVTVKHNENYLQMYSKKFCALKKWLLNIRKKCNSENLLVRKFTILAPKKLRKSPKNDVKLKFVSPLAFSQEKILHYRIREFYSTSIGFCLFQSVSVACASKVCLRSERCKRKEKNLCYRIWEN